MVSADGAWAICISSTGKFRAQPEEGLGHEGKGVDRTRVEEVGELREATCGGFEGAILAPKLVQTDLGNQLFAEGGSMTLPWIKRMRSTDTHGLLRHFCKEIGELLH